MLNASAVAVTMSETAEIYLIGAATWETDQVKVPVTGDETR